MPNMTSTTRCGVCLDDCGEKNIATTECGHITHLKCFIDVLATSDYCIYCRKRLNLSNKLIEPEKSVFIKTITIVGCIIIIIYKILAFLLVLLACIIGATILMVY